MDHGVCFTKPQLVLAGSRPCDLHLLPRDCAARYSLEPDNRSAGTVQPRGSNLTANMENPTIRFLGPNSILAFYLDPLGNLKC